MRMAAPGLAKRLAIARPTPFGPPVMRTAILPLSVRGADLSDLLRLCRARCAPAPERRRRVPREVGRRKGAILAFPNMSIVLPYRGSQIVRQKCLPTVLTKIASPFR